MSINTIETGSKQSDNGTVVFENNNSSHYTEYEIRKWDSLWIIAKRNWISIREIQELNWIKDINKIYAWKKLKIPKNQEENNQPNLKPQNNENPTPKTWESISKIEENDSIEAQELLWKLDYRNIQNLKAEEIPPIMASLKNLFDGWKMTQEQITAVIIPPNEYVACLFYSDRFIQILQNTASNYAWRSDPYARKYMEYYRVSLIAKENQQKHLLIFSEYAKLFWKWIDYDRESSVFWNRDSYDLPKYSELSLNHDDALDIFFRNVKREWNEEIWPNIYSRTSWIVIASKSDWKWWTTEWQYVSWWISPKSWNWVIVFNPSNNEYYEYSHLYSTEVKVWDVIQAWTLLWKWWNSWINARKPWRGWHLHYSIHKYTDSWNTKATNVTTLHSNFNWNTQIASLK